MDKPPQSLKVRPEIGKYAADMIHSQVSVLRYQVWVFSARSRFRPVPAPEPEDPNPIPDHLRPETRGSSSALKGRPESCLRA